MPLPKSIDQVRIVLKIHPLSFDDWDETVNQAEAEIEALPYVTEVQGGPYNQTLVYGFLINLDALLSQPWVRRIDAKILGDVEAKMREILTRHGFKLED